MRKSQRSGGEGAIAGAARAENCNGSAIPTAARGEDISPHDATAPEKKGKRRGNKFFRKFAGLVRSDVKSEWNDYDATFAQKDGKGITDKDHTKDGVAKFYNLVTDIYEWGWGPSFHFSPRLRGKGVKESSAAHETRIADNLGLAPGTTALDVGCGIGGPLITIASHSGAKVVGVTINEYQVSVPLKAYLAKQERFVILDSVLQSNLRTVNCNSNLKPTCFDLAWHGAASADFD